MFCYSIIIIDHLMENPSVEIIWWSRFGKFLNLNYCSWNHNEMNRQKNRIKSNIFSETVLTAVFWINSKNLLYFKATSPQCPSILLPTSPQWSRKKRKLEIWKIENIFYNKTSYTTLNCSWWVDPSNFGTFWKIVVHSRQFLFCEAVDF